MCSLNTGLCLVVVLVLTYHKDECACVVNKPAVWSSFIGCVLKVTVSRGYGVVGVIGKCVDGSLADIYDDWIKQRNQEGP